MSYRLYWGDLHSHCSISYGHGTVGQSLMRARQQLDFCSVTGHAFWPDMVTDRSVYSEIIDYHEQGFARLANNWSKLLTLQAEASEAGRFLALPSYEWHSLEFGDHNIYSAGPALELQNASNIDELRSWAKQAGAIVIPHHIGYAAGYRGIDWRHFSNSDDVSPFVEIYSLHGCSESDTAPYPMLHDMGPRDAGSTASAGWSQGHRFGIIASTDHHSAYPGSHGDGRIGVFATELTREALWEAFLARRVFAATGDRIDARLFVDDAWIGSSITSSTGRHLRIEVNGSDRLDRVELLKNERVVRRLFPEPSQGNPNDRYRLRITWGWGRKDRVVDWRISCSLSEGTIVHLETCFAGPPVVAPVTLVGDEEHADPVDLPHEVEEQADNFCVIRSQTVGNLSMRHATTQAVSIEVEAPQSATLTIQANESTYQHTLRELLFGGRSHYLRGWLSEAIRIGPLVPVTECQLAAEWIDQPEQDVDMYRLRVAQENGQWAWLSPIWVDR